MMSWCHYSSLDITFASWWNMAYRQIWSGMKQSVGMIFEGNINRWECSLLHACYSQHRSFSLVRECVFVFQVHDEPLAFILSHWFFIFLCLSLRNRRELFQTNLHDQHTLDLDPSTTPSPTTSFGFPAVQHSSTFINRWQRMMCQRRSVTADATSSVLGWVQSIFFFYT